MAARIVRANARIDSIEGEKERCDKAEEDLGTILNPLWTTIKEYRITTEIRRPGYR